MSRPDLTAWESDGLPEDDEEVLDVLIGDEFNFTEPELEGWYESCKAQAWINEQMAKHMDDGAEKAIRIAIARYFWRRADRIRRLTKKAIEEVESEESK